MKTEKRRYRIEGFRDTGNMIRVILTLAPVVKPKPKKMGVMDMMENPSGFAQQMMNQQMKQMIHDTFLITKEEYVKQKYQVGEFITVTIEKE